MLGKKINWTPKMINYLKDNYNAMTNRELAAALNLGLTATRMKLYEMGMKRMELEYWTSKQVQFLVNNYKLIGDAELAEIYSGKWNKKKGWTKKHIEKKRKYLKLKRAKEEIEAIHQRNVDNGRFIICAIKRWKATGQAKEGDIRWWRENRGRFIPRIKIKGRFINWNRWAWVKYYGSIPEGMNVVYKNGIPSIDKDNLELINDSELARRNSAKSSQGLSDNYVAAMLCYGDPETREKIKKYPEIIEAKRLQLKLRRGINDTRRKTKRDGKQNLDVQRPATQAA